MVLLLELAQDLGGAAELAPALLEAGVLQVDVQLVRQVVRRGPTVHVADLDIITIYVELIFKNVSSVANITSRKENRRTISYVTSCYVDYSQPRDDVLPTTF